MATPDPQLLAEPLLDANEAAWCRVAPSTSWSARGGCRTCALGALCDLRGGDWLAGFPPTPTGRLDPRPHMKLPQLWYFAVR